MDLDKMLGLLLYTITTGIVAMTGYAFKKFVSRLEVAEAKLNERPTQEDVRVLIEDKLDPLREDIKEIKDLLYKIIELNIKNK